jgi:hypothetical protein
LTVVYRGHFLCHGQDGGSADLGWRQPEMALKLTDIDHAWAGRPGADTHRYSALMMLADQTNLHCHGVGRPG